MNHYWFLHRCLCCKAQSSFFWGDKLLNHFSRLLICYRNPGTPHYKVISFDPRIGSGTGLPKMMSWGLLLTPTPALVPAATSTRYCTPAWRPPTTTERMVASTDLLTWRRVSLAKHQIWHRQTQQTEFSVMFCYTWLRKASLGGEGWAAPTLYSWMMPFCWSEGGGSHDTLMDVLLWLPTVNTATCCGGALGAKGSECGSVWATTSNKHIHNPFI